MKTPLPRPTWSVSLLGLLVSLLFTQHSSAQAYPYFPPPGMAYSDPNPTLLTLGASTHGGTLIFNSPPEVGGTEQALRAMVETTRTDNNSAVSMGAGAFHDGGASGLAVCRPRTVNPITGRFYESVLDISGSGDLFYCSGAANPLNLFTMLDNTNGAFGSFQFADSNNNGPSIEWSTAATPSCAFNGPTFTATGGCTVFLADTASPGRTMIFLNYNLTPALAIAGNLTDLWIGDTTPVKWAHAPSANGNDVQLTLGDTTSTSTLNLASGGGHPPTVNSIPIAAARSGTTGSIGGGALLAGACSSGTVTISGAASGQAVVATPTTYPGDGSIWDAYVSATNTVTVKICALIALTPTASTYNVRVIN